MTRPLSAAVLCVALAAPACPAQNGAEPAAPARAARTQGHIFDLGRDRAQRAVITAGDELIELDEPSSAMLRQLAGVLADLRAKGLEDLRNTVPPNPMLGDIRSAERVCTIHLSSRTARKDVAVYRALDGNYIAAELAPAEGGPPARAELRKDAWGAIVASWPAYAGPYESAGVQEQRAEVFELGHPYIPARWTIDQPTLSARFLGGRRATIEGSQRDLDQEKLFVRLPRGYNPRTPAGLLVWVDAGPSGRPPPPFFPALDELNIICIGAADSGNNRLVSTRYQLALDAAATAQRRFHVDPRRAYITGVSGGGRVSSMMQGCFPEVFTGAVPIVGISFYENVPIGTGKFWPAGYAKPKPDLFKLLRARRLAPITGQRDFNELETQHAVELYQRDGVPVRLFDDPKLGHELPSPGLFADALRWVDEPWHKLREAEQAAAAEALQAAFAKGIPENGPVPAATRRFLVKVTELGPWTEEAWRAADLLSKPRPAAPAGPGPASR